MGKKFKVTRKGLSTVSQSFSILLIFVLYVLADYFKFDGTLSFMTDWYYWVMVISNLVLVVALMLTVRAMQKNKKIETSPKILSNIAFVDRARRIITGNGYSKQLDEHIIKLNEDNKYNAYKRKVENKLNFILSLKLPAEKKDKLIKKYEELLEVPKEEVLKHYVKFRKITKTGLFAGVDGKIITYDEYDIGTHEAQDVAQMVGLKALCVFLFASLTGTMSLQLFWHGIDALWGTLMKLFALLFACNTAMSQANTFVEYNIEQSLNKRVEMLSNFINDNEDLKSKMVTEKQKEEKKEEEQK